MKNFRMYFRTCLSGMAVWCVACMLGGCQIYGVIKDATDKEEGRIVMKDGTEYVGRVKMPKCNTKNISIKTAGGEKLKLRNTDIAVLGVWKKTHTDMCHYLVSYPYVTNKMFSTKKEKTVAPQWMAVQAQGDNVEFYCCSYKYSIQSSGTLTITSVQNGSIVFVGRKKGEEKGRVIGYQGSGTKHWRTSLFNFLSDDPELCRKLENKEIEPDNLKQIADLYTPKAK